MRQNSSFFDKNMISLAICNPPLYTKLLSAKTDRKHYRFIEGKTQKTIPAFVDKNGTEHLLHSLISPEKEADKLTSTIKDEGYIIFLGLGGGFFAESALKKPGIQKVMVIDYDIDGLAELLCSKDYSFLFSDPRFILLHDPSEQEIEHYIIEHYFPCLHNGIRIIPLRPRCDCDEYFVPVRETIQRALEKVSSDYSVQAYFGKRWFSNIIRNIFSTEKQCDRIEPKAHVAICAAGPSLDSSLDQLKKKQGDIYIISTDTAAGSLLNAGIKPDAILSIDCQHISYLHFLGNNTENITLFLDLASPPLLHSRSLQSIFFASAHPLANYVSNYFKQLTFIDTSGANVTYAAVSLAEKLGAQTIEIYGADFSYPEGKAYTKGAFFYPYLNTRQNRFAPSASQLCDFLFKNKTLKRVDNRESYYYETRVLEMYRKNLEEKSKQSLCRMHLVKGAGAQVHLYEHNDVLSGTLAHNNEAGGGFLSGNSRISPKEFLLNYKQEIEGLPKLEKNVDAYIKNLSPLSKIIFTTILPTAAAIKRLEPALGSGELVEEVKNYCVRKIVNVL
jgi:hypothetical protein